MRRYSNEELAALVAQAADALADTVKRTPLEHSKRLTDLAGTDVYLKREDMQRGRSYKVRGAYNAISQLTHSQRESGVVCASAGNHAQGVAYACRTLKIRGRVYLPSTTPRQKRARIQDIGGEWIRQVIVEGGFDETNTQAREFAESHGAVYVHPFDDYATIAGQGTVGIEIAMQSPQPPSTILVPVGGGGLLAGVAAWVKQHYPTVTVIGVEPAGAPSMQRALEAGQAVTLPKVDSFVDGAAVARVGEHTWPVARDLVDRVISVPAGATASEMLALYQVEGIIAEPAGALASAAIRELAGQLTGPIVCIVSGGNNDVSRYGDIVERSLVHEGLRHYFLVTFPQEPGALRGFLDGVLGEDDDIVLFEYTKKNNRETGPALVGIDLAHREDLDPLLQRMYASPLSIEKLVPDSPAFEFLL